MSYQINKNKFLDKTELEALECTLSKSTGKYIRDSIIIEIALKTGARASEVLNLKWNDIDLKSKTIFITGLKNSNDREIPISNDLVRKLTYYRVTPRDIKRGVDKSLVFPISYQRLVQIWSFFKPSKKSFHSLRHTFAIQLYKKHKDIRLCQVALGHKNIKNTMVYAEYCYSTSELRKLIC